MESKAAHNGMVAALGKVEQGAAAASSMSDQATQLTHVVSTFKLEAGAGNRPLLLT